MSGLVLLATWCVVGGAVGALIGQHSGRAGVGLVLGSLCGVFGWVLLAGATSRRESAPGPSSTVRTAQSGTDTALPTVSTPVSWMALPDDQPMTPTLVQP